MNTFLTGKTDAWSSWVSILSTTLSAASYYLSVNTATAPAGCAAGLMSIAYNITNPNGSGGNPSGSFTQAIWFSQANSAIEARHAKDIELMKKKAQDAMNNVDLSRPDSWVSQMEAAIVPMYQDTFRYDVFQEGTSGDSNSGGSSGGSSGTAGGPDYAIVTVDLRDANGDGRKDYQQMTSALGDKYLDTLQDFEITNPPEIDGHTYYCEMLKDWAKKLGTITVVPGHYEATPQYGISIVPLPDTWYVTKWEAPGINWPGFDVHDIADALNSEKYFIDYAGHEHPYSATGPQ